MKSLAELKKQAWEIREANFSNQITFAYPNKTVPISFTGSECSLNCAHCGGHYLSNMVPLDKAKAVLKARGATSCLLSGGCENNGVVPLSKQLDFIHSLKGKYRLNTHLGLAKSEEIKQICSLVDLVSFDIVVDQETISEVYHLPYTVEDYKHTYTLLQKEAKSVVPHICIGLKGGEIKGEYQTLELLKELGAKKIVFIVFIPTKGTTYENRKPPELEEVGRVLATARIEFPDIPIYLGCMRPAGKYRGQLDLLAVQCGLNKIVIPTPPAVNYAKEKNLTIIREEECCAL
ncbi:MAG: radical SAM protein [bacterium]